MAQLKEMGYDSDAAGEAASATSNEGLEQAISWIAVTGTRTEAAHSANAAAIKVSLFALNSMLALKLIPPAHSANAFAAIKAEDASGLTARHKAVRELRREGEGVTTVDVKPSYTLIGQPQLSLPTAVELSSASQSARASVLLSIASCVDPVRQLCPAPRGAPALRVALKRQGPVSLTSFSSSSSSSSCPPLLVQTCDVISTQLLTQLEAVPAKWRLLVIMLRTWVASSPLSVRLHHVAAMLATCMAASYERQAPKQDACTPQSTRMVASWQAVVTQCSMLNEACFRPFMPTAPSL